MAEWLFEAGIGEDRAALVENDEIVEAAIEIHGGVRAGDVLAGRLATILIPGRRAIVAVEGGGEALLEPLPSTLTEGQALNAEIVREPVEEDGRRKLARVRVTDDPVRNGKTLRERLTATGVSVVPVHSIGTDPLEAAGWSELLEAAAIGVIAFEGGALRMSLTPAMTLFDVDGALPVVPLAIAGADAAGRAVRRFGIGGSIGIDLPTLPGKADRQAAAAALDAVLPQPFERTAVNGFGFLQIVRRRTRPSLPELLQGDPVGAAARALLRRAERAHGSGERLLTAAPSVIAYIDARAEWIAELGRRTGTAIALRADPSLAISAGHVHTPF